MLFVKNKNLVSPFLLRLTEFLQYLLIKYATFGSENKTSFLSFLFCTSLNLQYLCTRKSKDFMDNRQATLELGTKPVGKLLAQYALPAIIAMTASSLYNMIDSIFIGQGVGALAISGLAITFPLMNLSAAFGAAVGIGSSTCISVKLGQKDYKMAEHIFGNSFTLNLVVGIAFGLITLLFLDPILYFFRREREHHTLRTRLHARDFGRQRRVADLPGHERRAPCGQQAQAGNGRHDTYRNPEHRARANIHMAAEYGNNGRRPGHHPLSAL